MTRSRHWPNNAKEARDRAAEECVEIRRRLLQVLLNPNMPREAMAQEVGLALDSANTALRHLEGAGAQTKPR